MKKLTKKQKIILLVATCFLFVVIITSTVLITNSGEKLNNRIDSVSNPKNPSSPSDKPFDRKDDDKSPEPEEEEPDDNTQTLTQESNEAINILERKINNKNINSDTLLSELKTKHNLPN